ncbi:magnesium protoporphyrin IX methyltransferase [Thiohalocapsa marina]|uniref:Magnesium protoporphyrin IX methyltransferase n=1 Tax=Thiohalocapsa marina TaxID=424902 RepID=A0A5M8FGD9_9GAMM|nr:magnesium protoporphyrin IX methyltransferase [Thiohalocapsa marina]KAA6182836.1 magnesium protoporphyrin IX methyltransferase [Thiohalocapsa marina]
MPDNTPVTSQATAPVAAGQTSTAGSSYQQRRNQIEAYFDRTAADAWKRLTSDAPVSGIRATVREGRDRMRATLLGWLPADLSGCRLLDAGCGTGMLALEAARRGAQVYAVDLSPTLIANARERLPAELAGQVEFAVGDMMTRSPDETGPGAFDFVVSMDSIIHYELDDALGVLAGLAERAREQVLFTFAPRTPALAAMHAVGKLFPRGDRSPAIVPVAERAMRQGIGSGAAFAGWQVGRTQRIARGFYTSQAMELKRL